MAENSKIEWTDHTFNPWVGCTKVGPPCDHCYAESWAKRSGHPELWQGERRRTTAENWHKPFLWDAKAKAEGVRRKVFCASLADVFDNQVPTRWRDDLWHRIDQTPNLDWLLLTKRPQNIRKMLPNTRTGVKPWDDGWSNVWLGTTCGDQVEYDRNWPFLNEIPAKIRFISYEPALGPMLPDKEFIPHWIICGGESGSQARPMHPDWARMLRDRCKDSNISFFFKQWGEWAPQIGAVDGWTIDDNPEISRFDHVEWEDGKWSEPFRPMWCDFADGNYDEMQTVSRIGKKRAGRLLDGVTHSEFPR